MSSPPPASPPTVWPPSNPSGTVIPFPLPWGQTGCCPPGGMDALMKCYCDIQQASAFIGQIMIDQINNNPAVIAAIIAALEKSGSSVPLLGVTNGSNAQPGQVGEFISATGSFPYTAYSSTTSVTLTPIVVQPGDWDFRATLGFSSYVGGAFMELVPSPAGMSNPMTGAVNFGSSGAATVEELLLLSATARGSFSVPTLMPFSCTVFQLSASTLPAGTATFNFEGRRMR